MFFFWYDPKNQKYLYLIYNCLNFDCYYKSMIMSIAKQGTTYNDEVLANTKYIWYKECIVRQHGGVITSMNTTSG